MARSRPTLTIVELSTSQALNLFKKPIPNSVLLTAQIRNGGNRSAKLDYESKTGRAISSAVDKALGKGDQEEPLWALGIEARYQDGGKWEDLKSPEGWAVPGQEMNIFSSKQLEVGPGKTVSLSIGVSNPGGGLMSIPRPKEVRVFVVGPGGSRKVEKAMVLSTEAQ